MEKNNMEETPIKEKEEQKEEKHYKKRKSVFGIIANILAFLLLVFVVVESYLGFTGFNDVKSGKTPNYYMKITEEKEGETTTTTYHFGLYKAQKIEDSKKYSYKLLPFFLD